MGNYIPAVEDLMRRVLASAEAAAAHLFTDRDLPLYGVVRYHLGWAEATFEPASYDPGKRVRPLVCILSCLAAGGDADQAVPAAASIELLHNFTLVHDDIEDRSLTRRHRPTVWSLWGDGQAINAGDALFALAQLALLESLDRGVPSDRMAEITRAFNVATLRIVEGQVLDLGFERRWDISVDEYLAMIGGKTAALLGFAAWAGATIAGAGSDRAARFEEFGRALGLGFQVRDDLLGIWGETGVTGKPAADDIRRRKKSLPIIILASRVTPAELEELQGIYTGPEIDDTAVERVLALLAKYQIQAEVQAVVDRYHETARSLLERTAASGPGREALGQLAERLATRTF